MSVSVIVSIGFVLVFCLMFTAWFVKGKAADNKPGETGDDFSYRFMFGAFLVLALMAIMVALAPYLN